MSSQGVATTAVYMAYNTSTGAYVTGDSGNHTLRLVKDGTSAVPTNNPAEVDSANAPGAYKLALTAAETNFGTVWLGGKSSTGNVIIVPITLTFEILPTTPSALVDSTVALTENYATKGAAPTLAQAIFEIRSHLCEKSVAGTTLTTKKIDGSTTAETFTLNSATAPTSITRAT